MIEKRKHPFVITWFIFSIVFFIVFTLLMLLHIYPTIKEIESQKEVVSNLVKDYQDIKTKWITYDEFKKIKTDKSLTVYLQNIISEIDETFFTSNFVNSKWWEFSKFIDKKVSDINEKINSEDYKDSIDLYKKILPSYIESWEKDEVWIMTDFKFINYLEVITHTFNLTTNDKRVSVWNLNVLADYDSSNSKNTGLDATIFYIPYEFNISGAKKDIIDFIYFLENVGAINYSIDSKKIEIHKDTFINKKLIGFNNADILENPIIDIQSITFPEYIDSSLTISNYNDFKTYIKTTQWDEKIDVKVNVRFYVKWLPNHKILESIKSLSDKYDSIKNSYIKAKKNQIEDVNSIEKWLKYIQELDPTIKSIKTAKTDLNNVYKQVLEINKLLDRLWIILEKK